MPSRIAAIKNFGQKIWIDNISRELLASGTLQQLIDQDGIAGVTSNPAIFYKAIASDHRYQEQLASLPQQLSSLQRYELLAIEDIKHACAIMAPLYHASQHEDGYVSLEVSPHLCHDASATIASAKQLWQAVNAPNLMIKVPATSAGVVAFEELVAEGMNVNITLLFSLAQVHAIWDAYLRGLDRRLNNNLPINQIKTVASFFLSRVDTALDPLLPAQLQGTAAINLAKAAYSAYQQLFHGPRFTHYAAAGAKPQYLLWASTGTKNKNYSDVLYVEELIGPETINTVPDATLDAFRDHGCASARLESKLEHAPQVLAQVTAHGIDLEQVGNKLQAEGLNLFCEAFDKLLELVK